MRGRQRLYRKTEHGNRRHQLVRDQPAVGSTVRRRACRSARDSRLPAVVCVKIPAHNTKRRNGMKIKVWFALALLVVCTSAFAADEPKQAPKMPPEQQAMMDAWMKFMTPSEGHKMLDGM